MSLKIIAEIIWKQILNQNISDKAIKIQPEILKNTTS